MTPMNARYNWLFAAALLSSVATAGCKDKLVGISASISVTPENLAFGTVMAGATQSIRVSVSNVGSSPLEITSIKVATDPNHELKVAELLNTDCTDQPRATGTELVPGDCARFTATWSPNAAHAASGAIEIDSNDPQNDVLMLPVSGNSIAPVLQICVLKADGTVDAAACSKLGSTPPVIPTADFGAGHIGTAATHVLRLTNQGGAPLTFLSAPALTAATDGDYKLTGTVPGNSLAAGAHADLTVTLTPSSTGTLAGALELKTNDPKGAKVDVPLTGTVASFPIIQVTPAALAFGSTSIGTPQQIRVSVANAGTAVLNISAIKISSDPNAELQVDDLLTTDCMDQSRSAGMTLNPGECARFTAVWSPLVSHMAAGEVEVDSNDPAKPAVKLPVTGDAVAALLQACVLAADGSVDPTLCTNLGATPHIVPSVNFGAGIQASVQTRTVRLSNLGTGALTFSPQPSLSMGTSTDYTLGGQVPGGALAPGATTDFVITVDPTANGSLVGAMNISTNDLRAPTLSIPISIFVAGFQLCVSSPTGLSFGSQPIGSSTSQTLTFTNCGGTPFTVTTFSIAPTAPTTTQFTLPANTLPVIGSTLAVGGYIPLAFTYKPTAVQSDKEVLTYSFMVAGSTTVSQGTIPITGSGAAVSLTCGSPSKPNPVITMTSAYSTDQSGSGAYTNFTPTATPTPVVPLDWVKMTASATVATGSPTYTWTLNSQPAGSTTSLQGTGSSVKMWTLVSGAYVVGLTVRDGSTPSCTASTTVTINVASQGDVHVELTWDRCGDIDLHYVAPGDSVCSGGDIAWNRKNIDWGNCASGNCANGDGNGNNNASLDHDNTDSYGPENVTQFQPFDSPAGKSYGVWVFYFNDYTSFFGTCAGAIPTIRVYIKGVLTKTTTLSQGMSNEQMWHAADITVSNSATAFTVTTPTPTASNYGFCN